MLALPTWLRAALITAGQTLAASLLFILIGVLLDFQDWVSDPTNPVDISGYGQAAFTAVITALTFVVTAVFRKVKPAENSYPEPPQL